MLAEADRIRIERAVNATGLVLTAVFLTSVIELKRN